MPVDKRVTDTSRWSALREVKTPLTFFALAIILVESILFSVAQRATGLDLTLIISGMIGLLFTLVGLVSYLTLRSAKDLTTGGASTVGPEFTPVTESHAEGSIIEFDDYHPSAVNKIKELVAHSDGPLSLRLLAITGRSMMTYYLSDLIKEYKGRLDIELQVVDPTSPYVDVMPAHWGSEATLNVQEITRLYNARPYPGNLQVWKYKYLPCINGDIINEDHLILCFFGWDHHSKKLGDYKEYYVYYNRNSTTRKFFELFQSWFDLAPKSPWETNAKKS